VLCPNFYSDDARHAKSPVLPRAVRVDRAPSDRRQTGCRRYKIIVCCATTPGAGRLVLFSRVRDPRWRRFGPLVTRCLRPVVRVPTHVGGTRPTRARAQRDEVCRSRGAERCA
jgi:hypothetical protein